MFMSCEDNKNDGQALVAAIGQYLEAFTNANGALSVPPMQLYHLLLLLSTEAAAPSSSLLIVVVDVGRRSSCSLIKRQFFVSLYDIHKIFVSFGFSSKMVFV